MSKGKIIIVCIVGVAALLILAPMLMPYSSMPHGYDGIVGEIVDIEHDYATVDEFVTIYIAGVDPTGMGDEEISFLTTGVRLRITAPQFVGSLDAAPLLDWDIVTIDGITYNKSKTVKSSKLYFEMTAEIETYGEGLLAIEDVTFWIALHNNYYSLFTGADDAAAAVINVYTTAVDVKQKGTALDFDPYGVGFDLDLHTMEGDCVSNVPQWLADEYVLENFEKLSNIKFPIRVFKAEPTIVSPIDWTRVECKAEITLGIDVLLVGEWNDLRPYRGVDTGDPDLTWLEQLMKDLGFAGAEIVIWLGIIIGLVASIAGLRFIPDWRAKLVFVGLVWLIVSWQIGWLSMLLGSG